MTVIMAICGIALLLLGFVMLLTMSLPSFGGSDDSFSMTATIGVLLAGVALIITSAVL